MNSVGQEKFEIVLVQDVRYKVIEKSLIKDYLFRVLLSEWGRLEFDEELPVMDRWDWKVEKVKISDVRLWELIMQDKTFVSEMEKRIKIQRDRISRGEDVEPIVVRGRDMVIYDGYARLHALKELGKDEVLAYVGR